MYALQVVALLMVVPLLLAPGRLPWAGRSSWPPSRWARPAWRGSVGCWIAAQRRTAGDSSDPRAGRQRRLPVARWPGVVTGIQLGGRADGPVDRAMEWLVAR